MSRSVKRSIGSGLALLMMGLLALVPGTSATSPSPPVLGTLEEDGWLVWQGDGLQVSRLDGSERGPLFRDGTSRRAGHPDWSLDGTRLTYVSEEPDGTADIRVVDRGTPHAPHTR